MDLPEFRIGSLIGLDVPTFRQRQNNAHVTVGHFLRCQVRFDPVFCVVCGPLFTLAQSLDPGCPDSHFGKSFVDAIRLLAGGDMKGLCMAWAAECIPGTYSCKAQ